MHINELLKLLKEAQSVEEIDQYRSEIIALIPKVETMIGYDQQNYYHLYDLWFHSLHTIVNLPKDINDNMVYLAALLHDIGKPECQTYDERNGMVHMHYYGHPVRSAEITRVEIIPDLLVNGETLTDDEQRRLLYYVANHDYNASLRIKHLRRHLKLGATVEEFKNLMKIEVADAKAHRIEPAIQDRIDICTKLSGEYTDELYSRILEETLK